MINFIFGQIGLFLELDAQKHMCLKCSNGKNRLFRMLRQTNLLQNICEDLRQHVPIDRIEPSAILYKSAALTEQSIQLPVSS